MYFSLKTKFRNFREISYLYLNIKKRTKNILDYSYLPVENKLCLLIERWHSEKKQQTLSKVQYPYFSRLN